MNNDLIKTGATISSEISIREAYTEPNQDKDDEWIALVSKEWIDSSLLREKIKSKQEGCTEEDVGWFFALDWVLAWLDG